MSAATQQILEVVSTWAEPEQVAALLATVSSIAYSGYRACCGVGATLKTAYQWLSQWKADKLKAKREEFLDNLRAGLATIREEARQMQTPKVDHAYDPRTH